MHVKIEKCDLNLIKLEVKKSYFEIKKFFLTDLSFVFTRVIDVCISLEMHIFYFQKQYLVTKKGKKINFAYLHASE